MKIKKTWTTMQLQERKNLNLETIIKTNLIGMNGLELAILHDQLLLQLLLQDFH